MFGVRISKMGSASKLGLIAKAIAILRKYGTDAHVYLPGIGTVSGLTAGNYLDSAGTTAATVDNPVGLVVDSFGAVNATQATTASKPILRRGLLNLALYARDYTNASWTERGTTVSASAVLDPDGVAATKLSESATTDTHAAQQAFVSAASGYTVASIVKADTRTIGAIRIYDGAAGNATFINLLTGATLTNAAGNTASFVDLGGGWFLHAVSRALPGSASSFAQVCAIATDNVLSYAGDVTRGILLGRSAIFQGTYTAQQIIDAGGIPLTTTAAASNPSAGKYSWQFDGSNDSLSLSAPLFQMSDDHCVIAGVNPTSGAASTHVFQSGNGSASQQVCTLKFQADMRIGAVWCDDATTVVAANAVSPASFSTTYVATGSKVGTTGKLRVNGVQQATSSLSGIGTTTITTNGIIGAYKGGAAPFIGSIYPVIAIKGTVTDSDLLTLERFVGQLSGVQI